MQFIPADLGAREQKSTTYVCVSFEVRYPSSAICQSHSPSLSFIPSLRCTPQGMGKRCRDEEAFLLQSSLGSLQHVSTEGTSSSRQCRT